MRVVNILIYSAAVDFCDWQWVLPRSRPYRGLQRRNLIQRGRCALSSALPRPGLPTSSRA
jgi:hypothetical protein